MAIYGPPLSIAHLPGDTDLAQRFPGLRDLGKHRLYGKRPQAFGQSEANYLKGHCSAVETAAGTWVLIVDRRLPDRSTRYGRIQDRRQDLRIVVLTFASEEDLRDCLRYRGPFLRGYEP